MQATIRSTRFKEKFLKDNEYDWFLEEIDSKSSWLCGRHCSRGNCWAVPAAQWRWFRRWHFFKKIKQIPPEFYARWFWINVEASKAHWRTSQYHGKDGNSYGSRSEKDAGWTKARKINWHGPIYFHKTCFYQCSGYIHTSTDDKETNLEKTSRAKFVIVQETVKTM